MKAYPILFSTPMVQAILDGRKTQTRRVVKGKECWPKCPYGQPGDVLWVRESIAPTFGEYLHKETNLPFIYKADVKGLTESEEKSLMKEFGFKYKPSIHMTKAACRIFLQVKDVRVERLQDISEYDAIAEGVKHWYSFLYAENRYQDYLNSTSSWRSSISSFQSLWASINGLESWDANPQVWVIEFERIEKPAGWPF